MRGKFRIGLMVFAVVSSWGWAQLDLRLETPKVAYLQYSPIPFSISIKNVGSETVSLETVGGKPWLEMLVQSRDGLVIRAERPFFPPDKKLRAGESAAFPVDLAAHYLVRDPGGYQARATVRFGTGQSLLTEPLDFLVGRGEVIWSQSRLVGTDRYEYSLLKFYEDPNVGLYLRVEVPEKNIVYPCRRLGSYLPLTKPKAEFDRTNHLHLICQTAVGVYRIIVVSEDGRTLREETRQDGPDRPRLVKNQNAEVSVEGGSIVLPSNLREKLSTLQSRIGPPAPSSQKN